MARSAVGSILVVTRPLAEDLLNFVNRHGVLGELRLVLIVEDQRSNVNSHTWQLLSWALDRCYTICHTASIRRSQTVQQEFLMMADGAESTNGKIYILGGAVDRHMIPKDAPLPIQLRADIALGILVDWAETNNRHTFTLKLVDEDDVLELSLDAEFESGRPPGAKPGQSMRQLIAVKGPFPLGKPGAYKWVLELNGVPQEPPFRFWVDEVDLPAGAAIVRSEGS
jgi:hypothetical protein